LIIFDYFSHIFITFDNGSIIAAYERFPSAEKRDSRVSAKEIPTPAAIGRQTSGEDLKKEPDGAETSGAAWATMVAPHRFGAFGGEARKPSRQGSSAYSR